MKGNHATHIHANCDCTFAVRFNENTTYAGYDPDALYEQYQNAADGNSRTKINAMRRIQYASHKDVINAQHRAAYAKNNLKENNRARNIRTEAALREVSKSAIIDMKDINEIKEYFSQYNIVLEGLDDKELFAVKTVLAGVDDALEIMPEAAEYINTIRYNPNLKVMGKITDVNKLVQIGKSGLGDYGTGAHETAHAYDFYISNKGTSNSGVIIEDARKLLKLKKNSKEFSNLKYMLTADAKYVNDSEELFAYGIETGLSGVNNKLGQAIVNCVKENNYAI